MTVGTGGARQAPAEGDDPAQTLPRKERAEDFLPGVDPEARFVQADDGDDEQADHNLLGEGDPPAQRLDQALGQHVGHDHGGQHGEHQVLGVVVAGSPIFGIGDYAGKAVHDQVEGGKPVAGRPAHEKDDEDCYCYCLVGGRIGQTGRDPAVVVREQ